MKRLISLLNVRNVSKLQIEKVIHHSYKNIQHKKKYISQYKPSSIMGKYHYSVNGYSIVRFVPLEQIGTKNWLKPNNKLTPYYELMIGQDHTPKFWHLKDAIDYLKKYLNGEIELVEREE